MNREIETLKSDLRAIEKTTSILSNSTGSPRDPGTSVLYVRLMNLYDPPLGKLGLEESPIINNAYKVKILTQHLKTIMEYSREGHYFADLWKSRSTAPSPNG